MDESGWWNESTYRCWCWPVKIRPAVVNNNKETATKKKKKGRIERKKNHQPKTVKHEEKDEGRNYRCSCDTSAITNLKLIWRIGARFDTITYCPYSRCETLKVALSKKYWPRMKRIQCAFHSRSQPFMMIYLLFYSLRHSFNQFYIKRYVYTHSLE